MPIYQYQCEACGIRFERTQRFTDPPLEDCPECDGRVHRVIQPVGVVFKGSGFYVTDNRQVSSPTLRPPKQADTTSEPKAETSEEPKGASAASKKAEA